MEQQLRDAQYALAAADCAQLALMLSNERLRALCYADTLAALREEQAVAHGGSSGQQRQQPESRQQAEAGVENGMAALEQEGEPGSLAVAVERVRDVATLQGGLAVHRSAEVVHGLRISVESACGWDVPAPSAGLLYMLPQSSHSPQIPHTPPPVPSPQFSRLHADMQEESRHDRAALQQLASSLASPSSIPLLK